jgi:hypothetical protein
VRSSRRSHPRPAGRDQHGAVGHHLGLGVGALSVILRK